MRYKWSTESLRYIFKFKYESDELQNVFEVISGKHMEIQSKIADIDDDKYSNKDLEALVMQVQHLIEELSLKTNQNIEF